MDYESQAAARVVDILETLSRRGAISPGQLAAARLFEADFAAASLENLPASNPMRLAAGPSGSGRKSGSRGAPDIPGRILDARARLWRALDALGGADGPAGRAVWWVAGAGLSLKELSARSAWWGGRRLNPMTATGLLVAGLSVLEAHYRRGR
jgi:hypothetical protein